MGARTYLGMEGLDGVGLGWGRVGQDGAGREALRGNRVLLTSAATSLSLTCPRREIDVSPAIG